MSSYFVAVSTQFLPWPSPPCECRDLWLLLDTNFLPCTSPLQVRKGIRDAFDADDATVKESLKTLNTTTGYDMDIQICKLSATISHSLLCWDLISH